MTANPSTNLIAITGGAGAIASSLRPRLAQAGYQVRLIDILPPADSLAPTETFQRGSVEDLDFMTNALVGAEAVIHMGGIHREKAWAEICTTNITGTYVTLEAAHKNEIGRVLIASSTHAVGFTPTVEASKDIVLNPRPDTLYGVSKVAMEALGSLYSDKYGMKIFSVRIGTGGKAPTNVRSQSTWISSDDMLRMIEALLSEDSPAAHSIIWGVSNNTHGWVNLAAGKRVGYSPKDDASDYGDVPEYELSAEKFGEDLLVGGAWATDEHTLGIDNYPELKVGNKT